MNILSTLLKCPVQLATVLMIFNDLMTPRFVIAFCLLMFARFLRLGTMKVTDHMKQAKDTLISFEILPPLKGKRMNHL